MTTRILILLACMIAPAFTSAAHATPSYNNDLGTYTDPITTSAGFFPNGSPPVSTDPTYGVQFLSGGGGYVTLSASAATGHATTVDIVPGAKSAWNAVFVNYTGPASAITVTFIDGATETPLGSPVASTNPAWNGMVPLAGIPNTVTQGRLRFNLTETTIGTTTIKPSILDLQVKWTPESETRLGLSSPTTIASGAAYSYSVQVAVSNVTSDNLVVYVPRPSAAIDPFGQPNTLSFLSATNGGSYTSGGLSIDGRAIPANSVYWQLGDVAKGTTLRLNFTMRPPNGTLSGTSYGAAGSPGTPPSVFAYALNALDATAVGNLTTVTSLARLTTYKTSTAYILNNNYYAQAGTPVTWRVRVANWEAPFPSTGAQYYPDAVVTDCPPPAFLNALVGAPDITVSNGGTFDGSCIVWNLGTMAVGQQHNLSYTATLKGAGTIGVTQLDNSVTMSSGAAATVPAVPGANLTKTATHRIYVGIPETPGALFAKGVRIRGVGQASAGDDLPYTYVTYGEQLTWLLAVTNTSASALRDTVMVDRITDGTTFQTAWLPAGTGTIYYHTAANGTDDAPASPPDLNATTGVSGASWTLTPPSDLSTVNWVMFRVTEVASNYFPEVPASPVSITGEVTVTVDAPPPGTCPTPTLQNTASFNYFGYEPPFAETVTTVTPLDWERNIEPVQVKADVPSFDYSQATASPTMLNNNGTVTFTINVTNQQPGIATTDNALNTIVHVNVPTMDVAGGSAYLPLAGQVVAPNGVYNPGTDASYFTVDFGTIPGGTTRQISASFSTLGGFLSPESFALSASLTAEDDVCGPISKNVSAGATITASPWLVVSKESNFSTVAPDETFIYTLSYTNVGPAASQETWIVDRIPDGTYFEYAEAPLPGGEVRFAAAAGDNGCSILPSSLNDPTFVWTQAVIDACFTPGDPDGGNQFLPQDGDERWVAFRVDHGTLSPKQLPVGGLGSVSFEVYVDQDVPLDATTLRNNAAIFGADLLAAVSNDTLVLVAKRPSLALDLSCPGVLSAGENVDVTLTYYNDSTTAADTATVSLEVPAGYTYIGGSHAWNANSSGVVGTPTAVPSNGGQTLTWDIVAATGAPLESLQGGTFTITLQAGSALATGTLSQLTAISSATLADNPAIVQSAASCAMLIQNPDLCVSKAVNQAAPLPGEQVTWFVTVSNIGLNDAEAVTVVDTLPAGLTYVAGSTSVVSPIGVWAFNGSSDPVIVGSTLTWTNLKHSANAVGYFAPSSNGAAAGPVTLAFKTTVNALTAPGTTLTNNVAVSTTTAEDDVCANTATAKLKTPLPDPWISKAGPSTANPGDLVTWAIRFGNNSRAPAGAVLLVDDVPDLDGDGQADVTFMAPPTVPAGATIYFNGAANNTAAPAFMPATPTSNGWTTSPASLTRVNWIAVYVPSLAGNAGPFAAYVNFLLTDPVTDLPVPDASTIDNCVAISMPSGAQDSDMTNNTACARPLKTPGLDVAAGALCQPGGSIPGATVGDEISIVLSAENPATRPVYGVRLQWTPPPGFDYLGDDSAAVAITDLAGGPAALVDEFGTTFQGPVAWTRSGNTYYLGSIASTSDADHYRRVGLPAGSIVRITVGGVVANGQSNNTIITHAVTVATDNRYDQPIGDPPEDVYTNNDAGCDLTVYLPDPFVEKTGEGVSSSGPFTTGDHVIYTLSYNNAGGTDAGDVTLLDYFPAGLGFVVGSLSNIPDGATVTYLCCDNETPCVPTGLVDFNICGVEFHWDNMPAPANATTVYNTTAQFNAGSFADTIAANGAVYIDPEADAATGTWTSDLIPTAAGGNVVSWIRLAVESTVRQQEATLTFDILHGVTGAVIASGLTPDVSGGINLATLGALDGVPTIRVRANFEGSFFGCDYTYDHATPIPGVVSGTESAYVYGCTGPENTLFGSFELQDPVTNDWFYYPVVWEDVDGSYVVTDLEYGDASEGGEPYGALSANVLVGELWGEAMGEGTSAVVAWVRGTNGVWTMEVVAGDVTDPTYQVWTEEVDAALGRVLMNQEDNLTGESTLLLAQWDEATSQFYVESLPQLGLNENVDVMQGMTPAADRIAARVWDGNEYQVHFYSRDAGVWSVEQLPNPSTNELNWNGYSSAGGSAIITFYDTYPNDGQFAMWTNPLGLGWVAEDVNLAIGGGVYNVYARWIADDGSALALDVYSNTQPYDRFHYYERQPDSSWARVDILNLPAGYDSQQGEWNFDNEGRVWGYIASAPIASSKLNFFAQKNFTTGTWSSASFVAPGAQYSWGPQFARVQPQLDEGLIYGSQGSNGEPLYVYRIPDTFPAGTFETISLLSPTNDILDYLSPNQDNSTHVAGCTLRTAYGSDYATNGSIAVYWDTNDLLAAPSELAVSYAPGTSDGRFATRDSFQIDYVVGQIGDYFYGFSMTGNYDVAFISGVTPTGVKSWAIHGDGPDGQSEPPRVAEIARDRSWVAGTAVDSGGSSYAAIWTYNAATDAYDGPVALPQDPNAATPVNVIPYQQADQTTMWRLEGVIEAKDSLGGYDAWVPSTVEPSGWVLFRSLPAMTALTYDQVQSSASTAVDANGDLRAMVFSVTSNTEVFSYALVKDATALGGYRVEPLTMAGYANVQAVDIGANDVIIASGNNGPEWDPIVFVPSGTGSWSGQAVPLTEPNGGEPNPINGFGTIVARRAFADTTFPLVGGRLSYSGAPEQFVLQPDIGGFYTRAVFDIGTGTSFVPFDPIVSLPLDAALVHYNTNGRLVVPAGQPGFENGFVAGGHYPTAESVQPVASMQVYDTTADAWQLVPLPFETYGGYIWSIGLDETNTKPVIFGYDGYGYCAPKVECNYDSTTLTTVGWSFPDAPTTAVRTDLAVPGYTKMRFYEPRWTSSSHFDVTRAGSTTIGGGIPVAADGEKPNGKYVVFTAANNTMMSIATEFVDGNIWTADFNEQWGGMYRFAGDYLVGNLFGECQGECGGRKSMLWGCSEQPGVTLDRLEAVFRTDADPSVSYNLEVPDVCATSFTNNATISMVGSEITGENNDASVTLPVATSNISVTLSANPGVANQGDFIYYTASVSNAGPSVATDVIITVTIPWSDASGSNTQQLNLGDIAVGETRALTNQWFTQVNTADAGVTFIASADVTTTSIECSPDNNSASASTLTGDLPNVFVHKTAPITAALGAPFNYEITFGNNGNADATNFTLADAIPAGLTILQGASLPVAAVQGDGTPTCTLVGHNVNCLSGPLEVDDWTITIPVVANDCAALNATYVNTASVAADDDVNGADNVSQVSTTITAPPGKMKLLTTASHGNLETGEQVTFFVYYQNTGTGPITADTTLTATVPAGTTFLFSDTGSEAGGVVTWALENDLLPGQSGAVAFTAVVTAAASATLTSTANFDAVSPLESGACDVAATATTNVVAPGVHIVKQASSAVTCGGNVQWVLTVTNTGATDRTNLTITDTLASGFNLLSTNPAATVGGGTLSWNIPLLEAGGAISVYFTTSAPSGQGTYVTNSAGVRSGNTVLATTAPVVVQNNCNAAMTVKKAWDNTCAQPGDTVNVTVTWKNTGSVALAGAVISDFIQAGFDAGTIVPTGAIWNAGAQTITAAPGNILPGVSGSFSYTATLTAASGDTYHNVATMTATDVEPAVSNQVNGVVLDCDDNDMCTNDYCEPLTGCVNALQPNGSTEICDGIDNDCDGLVDADDNVGDGPIPADGGLELEACENQDGVCQGSITTPELCVDGDWLPCTVEIYEDFTGGTYNVIDDTCDGIDEDCSGSADEEYDPSATECGAGVCAATGLLECVNGALVDSCTPLTAGDSVDLICNGVDDDCDGEIIDEESEYIPESVACGENACATGQGETYCEGGAVQNTCDAVWANISSVGDDFCLDSTPTSDLVVVYLVVQGPDGQDAGSVRCWQNTNGGAVACDTDGPGSSVLKVYPELLCLPPEGATP